MTYDGLREFIDILEARDLLKRIKVEVDPFLEISEIVNRISKSGGPALLFERVKGSNFPVLVNLFGSMERMKLALGIQDFKEITSRIEELLNPEIPDSVWGKIRALPKLKKLNDYVPKIVKRGECKEVIIKDNPSLDILPILKTWPKDAGRFITLPLVFTRDPDSNIRNAGIYRMQVYDGKRTGMHWHIHKHGAKHYKKAEERGERLEVAVVIGTDPRVIYAASAPLPDDMDEMIFASFLKGKPVELVKCETIDLYVPADAEIVLEGYVEPYKREIEGPFGDHTGHYSLPSQYPVFHLNCITHRKDPIYTATVMGKPPMEDAYIGKASERIFLPFIKKILPEIVDINLPIEGGFHNLAFVSIDKRYPGHAYKIMHALWGLGQLSSTKMIFIFDKDVNIHNMKEVLWEIGNNVDPERDITFVKGPIDSLDHSSDLAGFGSKMGVDVTKKWKGEGFKREWPDKVEMDKGIKMLVDKRWEEYGFKKT